MVRDQHRVAHDSLFFRYSKGLATTFVAKDRVLAHDPVPDPPATLPAQPAEGRR